MKFLLTIIFFAFCLHSNAQTIDSYSKIFKSESILSDFKTSGQVLMVLTPFKEKEKKKNEKIKNIFDSSYKGAFIVVPEEKQMDPQYLDYTKYRYAISIPAPGPRVNIYTARLNDYQMYFMDRKGLDSLVRNNMPIAEKEMKSFEEKMKPFFRFTGVSDDVNTRVDNMFRFIAAKLNEY